jgi:hypothetical protein
MKYILIPSSTDKDIRLVLFELDREKTVIMSGLVPFDTRKLIRRFFCLFVVNSNDVVIPCSTKMLATQIVIEGHDKISFLLGVKNLFASLGRILKYVSIGTGH